MVVVFVSFEPSGASTKDARGHWAKKEQKSRSGGEGPPPRSYFFCSFLPSALARLSCLKEMETTATQANGKKCCSEEQCSFQ